MIISKPTILSPGGEYKRFMFVTTRQLLLAGFDSKIFESLLKWAKNCIMSCDEIT